MKRGVLLPFKRVIALDGTEWYAAWGLSDLDIAFASAFVGKGIIVGEAQYPVVIADPRYNKQYEFSVFDCGTLFWAHAEMSKNLWAQAVRNKAIASKRRSFLTNWLRRK